MRCPQGSAASNLRHSGSRAQLRNVIKTRDYFASDDAASCCGWHFGRKTRKVRSAHERRITMNQVAILYRDRLIEINSSNTFHMEARNI